MILSLISNIAESVIPTYIKFGSSAEFETQGMLDFCSKHNIASDIEVTPVQKVNEAYERFVKSIGS